MTDAKITVTNAETYGIVLCMTFGKIGRVHIDRMTKIIVVVILRYARSWAVTLDIELFDRATNRKGSSGHFIAFKMPEDADPKGSVGTVMDDDGRVALWTDVTYALKDAFNDLEARE